MRVALGFLMVSLLVGCSRGQAQEVDKVASVNGIPVTTDEFRQTYVTYLLQTSENDTPTNRYLHLDNLIDAHLLAQDARRNGLESDPVFVDFSRREKRKAVGGAFFDQEFLATLPELTDAQIRTAFRHSKEQRVVRHLFYRDPVKAEQAYERLLAGRSFLEEAVDCYGLTEVDSSAGFLGPVNYFQIDPAFARVAFTTPIDSFSMPVRSRFGYHIVLVEDAYFNPIITESEYQYKKKGVATQLRSQIRLSEGDAFVRSFMEGLDVRVNKDGVEALSIALKEIENRVEPDPVDILQNEDGGGTDRLSLLENLSPTTELATYEYDGKQFVFTAADYFFWLEDLPFAEATSRTGASVGRAIRNEVFAFAGEEKGLNSDSDVVAVLEGRQRLKLAEMMREKLRSVGADPTDNEVQEAFVRSGLNKKANWIASFSTVRFDTRPEALAAKEKIDSGGSARQFDSYAEYSDQDLSEYPQWKRSVVGAPIDESIVVGLQRDWYVLTVTERRELVVDRAEQLQRVREAIRPLVPEYRLLKELRATSEIKVDTVRFEQIMDLGE